MRALQARGRASAAQSGARTAIPLAEAIKAALYPNQ
jgi:hypothetical protein